MDAKSWEETAEKVSNATVGTQLSNYYSDHVVWCSDGIKQPKWGRVLEFRLRHGCRLYIRFCPVPMNQHPIPGIKQNFITSACSHPVPQGMFFPFLLFKKKTV
jgi:hypothetical protein